VSTSPITAIALPVRRIVRQCHPLRARPWGVKVRSHDVWAAHRAGRLVAEPGTDDHAGRIAWLMAQPVLDPIEIEVGIPALHCYVDWIITDGNHRVAAAVLRRDRMIAAHVGGDMNYARELFGVECTTVRL
jgi:hypothetical protein